MPGRCGPRLRGLTGRRQPLKRSSLQGKRDGDAGDTCGGHTPAAWGGKGASLGRPDLHSRQVSPPKSPSELPSLPGEGGKLRDRAGPTSPGRLVAERGCLHGWANAGVQLSVWKRHAGYDDYSSLINSEGWPRGTANLPRPPCVPLGEMSDWGSTPRPGRKPAPKTVPAEPSWARRTLPETTERVPVLHTNRGNRINASYSVRQGV